MYLKFLANASSTPPTKPSNPSVGYPSNGNPQTGEPPTIIGAYWFFSENEEKKNLLAVMGIEPDDDNNHQLADFFNAYMAQVRAISPVAVEEMVNYVTKAQAETISGAKTFTAALTASSITAQGVIKANAGVDWNSHKLLLSINGRYGNTSGAISVDEVLPGTIHFYMGTSIPSGYLLCNGGTIQRSQYPRLVPILGNIPAFRGDGSTTLVLPNLNDRFLEMTTDLSKVGEYVEAGLPNITGYGDIGGSSATS